MRFWFLFFSSVAANLCLGDTLRVSAVGREGEADTERMIIKCEDSEEIVFVKKEVLLGDRDVEWAQPAARGGGILSVTLNEEGGRKFREITSKMDHGTDRLALIIEGKLVTAPVIQGPLGSAFEITGLWDLGRRELHNLARRMSGRSLLPEGEEEKSVPAVKSVPYTEAEFQKIKSWREKNGIFYLEVMPTSEELERVLRKGMNREKVIEKLGQPLMTLGEIDDGSFNLTYEVAPEKRSKNPDGEMRPTGFTVFFEGGEFGLWGYTSRSTAGRAEKILGLKEPTLKAIFPEADFSAAEFDMVSYVESIRIPDLKQPLSAQDLDALFTLVSWLPSLPDDQDGEASIDLGCDVVAMLLVNLPEVSALRDTAKDGQVRVDALSKACWAYIARVKDNPSEKKEGSGSE